MALELRGSATNGVEPEGRSSGADLVPSNNPLETSLDFAASIKARRLFFLGSEMVEDGDGEEMRETVLEEGIVTVFICSDSFCFFFLVDGGSDAELGDNDSDKDVAGDITDTFLLFLTCGLAFTDSICVDFSPFAGGVDEAAAS